MLDLQVCNSPSPLVIPKFQDSKHEITLVSMNKTTAESMQSENGEGMRSRQKQGQYHAIKERAESGRDPCQGRPP